MKLMYDNLIGVGGFVEAGYWSSTEYDPGFAWYLAFTNGYQTITNKFVTVYVRPVRAF